MTAGVLELGLNLRLSITTVLLDADLGNGHRAYVANGGPILGDALSLHQTHQAFMLSELTRLFELKPLWLGRRLTCVIDVELRGFDAQLTSPTFIDIWAELPIRWGSHTGTYAEQLGESLNRGSLWDWNVWDWGVLN